MHIRSNGTHVANKIRKHSDSINKKQMDFSTVVARISQSTESIIETKLSQRFPDAATHWYLESTLSMSSSEVGFSIKLKDLDEYGRISKENYASEIDGVIKECMEQAIMLIQSQLKGGGFGA